MLDIFASFALD